MNKSPASIFGRIPIWLVDVLWGWGFLTAMAVLIFPAWKQVWLGYVPVAAGVTAGWLVLRTWRTITRRLDQLPGSALIVSLGSVVVLFQAAAILLLRPEPAFDGLFVFREALQLARDGTMSALTYYAPFQTWWYALFLKLCGESITIAQLSHIPWAVLMVALTCVTARRFGPAGGAGAATLALALYPSFLAYVLVTPYYFYIYTACLLLLAFAWLKSGDADGWTVWAFLGGLAAGVGALTKAVLLLAPAQAALVWMFVGERRSLPGLLRKLALFLAGMAVVMLPWVARNLRVFGEPVLVCTSGGLVLYSANNPDSNGLYSPLPDESAVSTPAEMLEHSRDCSRKARQFMREEPAAFLGLVVRKNLHTWGNETTFAELINIRGRAPSWLDPLCSALFQTGWSALVLMWVVTGWRWFRARREPHALELVAAMMLGATVAVYSLFEGGARHHLTMVPFLVLAIFARQSIAARRSDASPGPAAAAAIVASPKKRGSTGGRVVG